MTDGAGMAAEGWGLRHPAFAARGCRFVAELVRDFANACFDGESDNNRPVYAELFLEGFDCPVGFLGEPDWDRGGEVGLFCHMVG
jgi:hypothetical protein